MKPPDLKRVSEVWDKIIKDQDARKALEKLERDGFPVSHLRPQDPSFRNPSWADYLAAIPFLPNKQTHRRIRRSRELRRYGPLVRILRELVANVQNPFCEVLFQGSKKPNEKDLENLTKRLDETAEFLEHLLSWDWCTREVNPQNHAIACLRWEIWHRTGRPHDAELSVLIYVAFEAAGVENPEYFSPARLERIKKIEEESRVKATVRLRSDRTPISSTRMPT
jgi:hypothetical protein